MPATRVITLGTAGGPRWWPAESGRVPRAGISTAVVVGDRHYLVDAGLGAGRMMQRAGLEISGLAGVFLTHLHSDHTTDLANLAISGLYRLDGSGPVIPIIGPGDRGMLPPVSSRATTTPTPIAPALPTPGTADMFRLLMEAHATDLNDRVLDALRPSPLDLFRASDIAIPADVNFHANDRPTPDMAPFVVFEDDRVRVSATLVEHPPITPAFAFRFDTDDGSVAISGDTRETANMARIARDVDLLLHEAIDFDWIDGLYPQRLGRRSPGDKGPPLPVAYEHRGGGSNRAVGGRPQPRTAPPRARKRAAQRVGPRRNPHARKVLCA